MNITELKDKINSLNLLDLFPDIHGYGIALKEIKGITTDDLCVQFYVEKKNPQYVKLIYYFYDHFYLNLIILNIFE